MRVRSALWGPILAVIALSCPCAARAQARSHPADAALPSFGTSSASHLHIGYGEFIPEYSTDTYALAFNIGHVGRRPTSAGTHFDAHPHVPTGARLASLRIDFCDTNPTQHLNFELVECDLFGVHCNSLAILASSNPAVGNCGSKTFDMSPENYTVQNETRQLILTCAPAASDASNVLLGADIGYTLQVSAAPAVATFADVPTTSPQFRFVEALVAAGITAGCGGGNYCPTNPVTRGQMAVFLATALGLHFPD